MNFGNWWETILTGLEFGAGFTVAGVVVGWIVAVLTKIVPKPSK